MTVYSVWPYFVCMVALLAIAAAPLFEGADTPPNPGRNRVSSLDGLRGFLAFGVFFHHTAIYNQYLMDGRFDGKWYLPPSQFYSLIGQVGVALFFMITGYLFWSRMISARGRPDWLALYTGRVFRIGPLYIFAAVIMLSLVFSHTDHLRVPLLVLAKQVGEWLSLGFFGNASLNEDPKAAIVLPVVWTLKFEWAFYISLLATSFAARSAKTHLLFTAAGLLACLAYLAFWNIELSVVASKPVCATLFFTGMVCASLKKSHLAANLPNGIASILVIVLTGAVFVLFPSANHALPIILMGLAFFLIVSGCDVFGLLASRPARRLGNISYGIYLLHPLLLSFLFSLQPVVVFALKSPLQYWATVFLSAVLLVVIATAAHVWIERPGIELGKRVNTKLVAQSGRMKSALTKILASQRAS